MNENGLKHRENDAKRRRKVTSSSLPPVIGHPTSCVRCLGKEQMGDRSLLQTVGFPYCRRWFQTSQGKLGIETYIAGRHDNMQSFQGSVTRSRARKIDLEVQRNKLEEFEAIKARHIVYHTVACIVLPTLPSPIGFWPKKFLIVRLLWTVGQGLLPSVGLGKLNTLRSFLRVWGIDTGLSSSVENSKAQTELRLIESSLSRNSQPTTWKSCGRRWIGRLSNLETVGRK
ncbi:hypothetical protein M9H77_07556 [Catharanthus roseus]|uniref:Uncharacterized protein n=1 Tax=Catharanthus roseus TaxID=4058 RepID=A0ACC0BVA5_CATRO|nr:hypothetical protein M9H77_07556 [Catharanthus roseus]